MPTPRRLDESPCGVAGLRIRRPGRRRFLSAAAIAAATPGALRGADAPAAFAGPRALVPIDARADRVVAVAVCTRPFRAAGPRIEVERLGTRTVVHNYGHGGSGWSLSWGSAAIAVDLALASHAATGEKRLAVIGCGAIGLTTALTAQRAGFAVRIYASERPPDVRSANATGVWSPDSRICTVDGATPAFARTWETMARRSFRTYQTLLGLPGAPVEWREAYYLSDVPFDVSLPDTANEPPYPRLEATLLAGLRPAPEDVADGAHPFPVAHVRRFPMLTFNLTAYARLLTSDFLAGGGTIVTRTFATPHELTTLPERTIVNATGWGARALFGDASLVPVRGQTARLVPQPDVDYCVFWRGHNVAVVPRRDGILVQAQADDDFGNADTTVDRAQTDAAVARLATLFPVRR